MAAWNRSHKSSLAIATLAVLAVAGVGAAVATFLGWYGERAAQAPEVIPSQSTTAQPLSVDNPTSPHSFRPIRVVQRPPVVTGFDILSPDDVRGKIDDDESVLGVEIDGHARAYLINMMTGPRREVFNDQLGGQLIAATW